MSAGRARTVLRGLIAVAAFASLGAASGVSPQRVSAAVLERWRALTGDERDRLRERMTVFRALSSDERAAWVGRYDALREALEQVMAGLSPDERTRIEGLEPAARRRALEPLLAAWLSDQEGRIKAPLEADPAFVSEDGRLRTRSLEEAARMRAVGRVGELEQQGFVKPGTVDDLLELPPWELKLALDALRKRWIVEGPAASFRRLPAAEQQRLRDLPPRAFLQEMRRHRGRPVRPEMGAVVERLLGPRADGGQRPLGPVLRHLPDRRSARGMVEDHLRPDQLAALDDLDGAERRMACMRFLRENAEATLSARGVGLAERRAIFAELERLPMKARLPYLIRLDDPSVSGRGGDR